MMPARREDPVVSSSRNEALFVAVLWASALTYTVGYCFNYGYGRILDTSLEGMTFVFGWPDWVFWGILVPWLTCTAISIVFATFIMCDAPLGEEAEEEDLDGDAAHG
jgi:hypothetical protein